MSRGFDHGLLHISGLCLVSVDFVTFPEAALNLVFLHMKTEHPSVCFSRNGNHVPENLVLGRVPFLGKGGVRPLQQEQQRQSRLLLLQLKLSWGSPLGKMALH